MIKKLLALLLGVLLCVSLTACGTKNEDPVQEEKPVEENTEEKAEEKVYEIITYGNDDCGYLTLDIYPDILRGVSNGSDMVDILADNTWAARITIETLSFSKENPDFEYAADFLHRSYFNAYNGGDKIYSEEAESETVLDGERAWKVTAERKSTTEEFDIISCIGYVTTNPNGDFVSIKVEAPKDGKDKDGNFYPPTIDELADLVERTYSKTNNN